METLVICMDNILEPHKHNKHTTEHATLIDYLQDHYPDGFLLPYKISINSKIIEVENYDYKFKKDDICVIAFTPAFAIAALGVVGNWILNLAVLTAVNYAISEIFSPTIPDEQSTLLSNRNQNPSSIYSLNSQQNRFNKGELIPIVYGRIRQYPSLIEQPYYRYDNDSNEMYLYQMLALSAGRVDVEQLLISDTPSKDMTGGELIYKVYQKEFFAAGAIKADILSTYNDDEYHMRVKTLPEISGLELRGTPSTSQMYCYFVGSDIHFLPFSDGLYPDLSSLVNGSNLDITNSSNNDGSYIIEAVDIINNIVTVQSHIFNTYPINIGLTFTERQSVTGTVYFIIATSSSTPDSPMYLSAVVGDVYKTTVEGVEISSNRCIGKSFDGNGDPYNLQYIGWSVSPNAKNLNTIKTEVIGTSANFKFETSYGAYTLEEVVTKLDSIEVDIEYQRGIYNSDTSGNFIDREVSLEYKLIGNIETEWLNINTEPDPLWPIGTTEQNKTNTALRRSYKLPIPIEFNDTLPLKIRLRRVSPEVADIKSQDQAIVTRVKSIYNEPDITNYGDITILWVKAKASNGISQAGQFRINAWINRTDVNNDLKSVLTDIYSNTAYGAKLDALDLVIPDDPAALVNGAIDSSMSVLDALQMVGKANRYQVYLSGAEVVAKADTLRPIRTYTFSEINIIRESLSITYQFDDEYSQNDGYEFLYRDPNTFELQSEIYPKTALFPKSEELFGCTDSEKAYIMAIYSQKMDASRRTMITFETDEQGFIPEYLSRVGFLHQLINNGFSGRVAAVNGRTIEFERDYNIISMPLLCTDTIDCAAIFCEYTHTDTIVFMDVAGLPTINYTFTIIDNRTILLNEDPPPFLYTGYDYDKTPFVIGSGESYIRDYIVTSIKPSRNKRISIEAVNYDPDVYNFDTLLIDGEGAILTDGNNIDLIT